MRLERSAQRVHTLLWTPAAGRTAPTPYLRPYAFFGLLSTISDCTSAMGATAFRANLLGPGGSGAKDSAPAPAEKLGQGSPDPAHALY